MEEKIDKYQESVENVETGTVPRHEGLSSQERVEPVQKPELSEQAEPSKEAEPKKEESVEAVEPESPSEDSSPVVVKDDKTPHSKKIEEIKKLSKEEQIKALCNLVLEKNVDFATGVAKGLDDAYVLDEFHDELDKLDLIKKGKLKEL